MFKIYTLDCCVLKTLKSKIVDSSKKSNNLFDWIKKIIIKSKANNLFKIIIIKTLWLYKKQIIVN